MESLRVSFCQEKVVGFITRSSTTSCIARKTACSQPGWFIRNTTPCFQPGFVYQKYTLFSARFVNQKYTLLSARFVNQKYTLFSAWFCLSEIQHVISQICLSDIHHVLSLVLFIRNTPCSQPGFVYQKCTMFSTRFVYHKYTMPSAWTRFKKIDIL